MKPEEIKARLQINKAALDEELAQQPVVFQEISDLYEDAVAERDALKEALATRDAELFRLYKDINEKATEAMIKSLVQTDDKHREAFDAWLESKTEAAKLGALKDSFHTRSYMIRDLASLYVAGYYETTSIQGTNATDTAVYKERRRLMAEARRSK